MLRTVEIPLWALMLLVAFAAVTFASHFLFPSVRWFLRRRAERLVARLNARLRHPIQPFKLARRADTVMRLVHDPAVAEAIAEHARKEGVPEEVAFETARRYAREIVPGFSATLYFSVAMRLARWLSKHLYRVRVSGAPPPGDPDTTTVFVMNHRSNMDYVLVTWLLAGETSLAYAVGEWARRWPLRPLIRALGGYFVRRRDLNPLYRRVLARYVQRATAAGVTQAVFPEGRLSRDGALQPPKLGILHYVAEGGGARDVRFVPVALNYERVIEDRSLLAAREGPGAFRLHWWQVARYLLRHVQLRLTGRFTRFGYAAVSYGEPLSLRAFLADGHHDPTEALGGALMARVEAVLPVLPVPLVAEALLAGHATLPAVAGHLERRARAFAGGRHPLHHAADAPRDVALAALRMLEVRGVVRWEEGRIAVDGGQIGLLRFYARTLPTGES
ncbi:1-acyl-sn-glycerol-3-phosphate acyltransferase [Jannaschia sp. W003]|uniref:1-acyl-sn-glycerol-3-phosphate acyltransferase n=1 Tax=Jannaschia sp. W003 TaxID=2867012 RepID=UPI0021A8CCD3|nr:1-acyl-sn-glycerol-3-phosphate acyltransferase [Jannaschia sp. W003]UWQ21667.1 1-acyl-sn-glycerol-3-phosphate acyltransferase [Jannaschia sp. W003]